jgi:hypothetical protein
MNLKKIEEIIIWYLKLVYQIGVDSKVDYIDPLKKYLRCKELEYAI